MGLWNAISGKYFRFNRSNKAKQQVAASLRTFVPSRLRELPGADAETAEYLIQCRNELCAFFLGAEDALVFAVNDSRTTDAYPSLLSMGVHDYLHVICSLHTGYAVERYVGTCGGSPNEDTDIALVLVTGGICEMYGRRQSYMTEWYNRMVFFLEESPEPRVVFQRINDMVYDEIAPIVGGRLSPVIGPLFWSSIRMQCLAFLKAATEIPGVCNEAAEAFLREY